MTNQVFTGNEKPFLAKHIYLTKIKNFLLLYNIYSDYKFMLLDIKAQRIFNLCDGKNSIKEVHSHPKLLSHSFDDIEETILRLVKYGILVVPNYSSENVLERQHSNKKKSFGVWLHITNSCNFNCSYCYINQSKGHMPISVAKNAILNLVNQCKEKEIESLSVKFAGGEPLMVWENLMQIIDFTKRYCDGTIVNPRFNIVSNGTLVTKSRATYLHHNHIPISISLDGIGIVNDNQRFYHNKRGSFSSIERGIQILKAEGWKPSILVTITEKNIGGLQELTKHLLNHGLNFRYSFFKDCNKIPSEHLHCMSERYVETLVKCFADIEEWMLTKNWNFNVKLCDINLMHLSTKTCGIGKNFAAIDHEGKIALCQMIFNQSIGNITHEGIIEAVYQQNIMPELRSKNVDSYLECKQCIWKNVCAGGCSVFTHQQYGKLDRPSPYCHVFKQLIPRIVRLRGIKLLREHECLKK